MGKVLRIVVHCTATRAGDQVTRESLYRLFFVTNGWRHWGYHIIVYPNGQWEILQPNPMLYGDGGRITDATKANGAKGYNYDSFHIAYVGGLDAKTGKPADTRTPEQKQTLRVLVTRLKHQYKVSEVVGHRDLPGVKKACPCFDARKEYENV